MSASTLAATSERSIDLRIQAPRRSRDNAFVCIEDGPQAMEFGLDLLPSAWLLAGGLVLASDLRSNAGVDQVQKVSKLALITQPAAA